MDTAINIQETARRYQDEAFLVAKRRNTIIRMPTGSGKTLTALMLIKHVCSHVSTDDRKLVLLVVEKVLLGQQHVETLSKSSYSSHLTVEGYFGRTCDEEWTNEQWRSEFERIDVGVFTAQILLNRLRNGDISLSRICLLIFDEAHHARKSHPYAKIMHESYHDVRRKSPATELPKILGLTASPVYSGALDKASSDLAELEKILDSRTFEVREYQIELEKHAPKPLEVTLAYDPASCPSWLEGKTEILAKTKQWIWDIAKSDRKVFGQSNLLNKTKEKLGLLATDIYLFLWLKDLLKHFSIHPRTRRFRSDPEKKLELQTLIESASSHLDSLTILPGDLLPGDQSRLRGLSYYPDFALSPRVQALFLELASYAPPAGVEKASHDFHGLIFCELRLHCEVLSRLISMTKSLRLAPGHLVGHGVRWDNGTSNLEVDMSIKEQFAILCKFRRHELNLLVATSIAEEGIDVPKCNIVVRFDAPVTIINYVQSRGRARSHNSRYIILGGNEVAAKCRMFAEQEKKLIEVYATRPDDDLGVPNYPERRFDLPTGAFFTTSSSVALLNELYSQVRRDPWTPHPKPVYQELPALSYSYEVFLSPISGYLPELGRPFVGPVCPSKKIAKAEASFEACKYLVYHGVLTDELRPAWERRWKESATLDAEDRPVDKGQLKEVEFLATMPNPWGNVWLKGSPLWQHSIALTSPSGETVKFGLLCGSRLTFGSIELDTLPGNKPYKVDLLSYKLLSWNLDEISRNLSRLNKFNRECIGFALNPRLKCSLDQREAPPRDLLFFVCPLDENDDIDWNIVQEPSKPIQDEDAMEPGTIVVVPVKSFVPRVFLFKWWRPDTTIHSELMIPTFNGTNTYEEYMAKRAWLTRNSPQPSEEDQFIEVKPYVLPSSLKSGIPLPSETSFIFPISLCRQSAVSQSTWEVFHLLPQFSRRIHDEIRACRTAEWLDIPLDNPFDRQLLIDALTLPHCQTLRNYERLETLGDTLAKFSVAAHLYLTKVATQECPDEGVLSTRKDNTVSNLAFRKKALSVGLQNHLFVELYRVGTWIPPNSKGGTLAADGQTIQRMVPRRALSDCYEAILGASYLIGNFDVAFRAGKAMGLACGPSMDWPLRGIGVPIQTGANQKSSIVHQSLEDKLGYTFGNQELFLRALSHRSNPDGSACYECEEFLGDAIVDLFITEYLFRKFSTLPPSRITLLKSMLVCNSTMAFLAVRMLNIHEYIDCSSSSGLNETMEAAAKEIYTKEVREELLTKDPWLQDTPKVLGDVFESLMGALFIDSGCRLDVVKEVLTRLYSELFPLLHEEMEKNPWTKMTEYFAALNCKKWEKRYSEFVNHEPRTCTITFHGFEMGEGTHLRKTIARNRAAERALASIAKGSPDSQSPYKTLREFCQCQESQEAEKGPRSREDTETEEVDAYETASEGMANEGGLEKDLGILRLDD